MPFQNDDCNSEIKVYVVAVMHWLSEFPNSPITPECSLEEFIQPTKLFEIFQLLFSKEESSGYLTNWFIANKDIQSDIESIYISQITLKQIEILTDILDRHLRSRITLNTFLYLNLYKLIMFNDYAELKKLCQILFRIGTFTSILSANGLAYFEFLTDNDKQVINQFKEPLIKTKKNKYPGLREKSMPPADTNSDYESADPKSESCYLMQEEELEALNWEISIFENLVYKLAKEM